MNSGIYTITHIDSGTRYVGSSVNIKRRWLRHKKDLKNGSHRCSHLQRAYNKYGQDAFIFELVETVVAEKQSLLEAEQRWLDLPARLYNTCKTAGSPLGMKLTEEQKQKISIKHKGRKHSPEWVEANRLAQLLVPRNEERDQKFAGNRLGTKQTPEQIAKRVANANATKALRTDEQKRATAILKNTLVIINGVEYLSYTDAGEKLNICRKKLKRQYPN